MNQTGEDAREAGDVVAEGEEGRSAAVPGDEPAFMAQPPPTLEEALAIHRQAVREFKAADAAYRESHEETQRRLTEAQHARQRVQFAERMVTNANAALDT